MRKYYKLGDNPTNAEYAALGLPYKIMLSWAPPMVAGQHAKAQFTGEFRSPLKGEWYLSGASIAAYRAPNDLTTGYNIARLIVVERKTSVIETVLN